MKKLSKIVALLLAGALTMLLFTACGGGGGGFGHRDKDEEDRAFGKFKDMAQASNVTENDKSLQAVADGHLQKDLNSSVEIFGAKLVGEVHVDGVLNSDKEMTVKKKDGKVWTVVTILAQQGNKKVPYGITSEELANKDKVIVNVDQTTKKVTTGLAVGAVKKGDKVYVAIAMTKDMNLMK